RPRRPRTASGLAATKLRRRSPRPRPRRRSVAASRDDAPAPLTSLRSRVFHARMEIRPVTLEGRHVRLEPLDLARHWPGRLGAGLEPPLWLYTNARVRDEDDLRRYFERALAECDRGVSLPFATIHRASGRVAGSTRFGSIVPEHKRVEIGWTWL